MNEIIRNKIWTIDNFLSPEECQSFINKIDSKTTRNCFTTSGVFENDKFHDPELSQYFFDILKKNIEYEDFIRPNTVVMTGKYNPEQSFSLHTDTGLYYNRATQEKSRYTLLIYLNDDYRGGQTIFYTDDFQELTKIKPAMGKALLFDIDMWHCGDIIENGHKYWVGCEIIGSITNSETKQISPSSLNSDPLSIQ